MAGARILSNCLNVAGRSFLSNRIIYNQVSTSTTFKSKGEPKQVEIPPKPKRPLTPFLKFANDQRQLLKVESPNLSPKEITKECGKLWNLLDDSKKLKYQEGYDKEKLEFIDKYNEYKDSLTDEQLELIQYEKEKKAEKRQKRRLKKIKRENNKPNYPLTSFGFFIKEKSKEGKDSNILYKCIKEWNELSVAEKEKYQKMQDADKQRYEKEMVVWEEKMFKEGKLELIRKRSPLLQNKDEE